eukprot:TRINITY_DN8361_c0_g1_i3.p1 TRINITY_DN8361_c0_g1~~TRINITY_DN8361_c0_g1_i3.p1  ORF type:complete len:257 (+),score=19.35 TRINITY_DN8361_c0_g1_i3:280-1050(+)
MSVWLATNRLCYQKKPENATRLVCLSDTHTKHWGISHIPDGDVLIHSGDFTMCGREDEVLDFVDFMKQLPHKHKIVIAGNHDTVMYTGWYQQHYWRYPHGSTGPNLLNATELKQKLIDNFIYLEDSEVTINNIRFYGTPWTPAYHDWAFMLNSEQIENMWKLIPTGVDVLITHGPPFGCHLGKAGDVDVGDKSLADHITNRIKPSVNIFGHIHVSYGSSCVKGINYVNAALVTKHYKPANKPIVVDVTAKFPPHYT